MVLEKPQTSNIPNNTQNLKRLDLQTSHVKNFRNLTYSEELLLGNLWEITPFSKFKDLGMQLLQNMSVS